MAALQSIRSRGKILMAVLILVLLVFVGETVITQIIGSRELKNYEAVEAYGDALTAQEYQEMKDEYVEAVKLMQGVSNFTAEQEQQLNDQVFQTYLQNAIIQHQANALGLIVTDKEVQDVLRSGNNRMLASTPFVNQQTGRFDLQQLQQFLTQYEQLKQSSDEQAQQQLQQYTAIYKYWKFTEKNLRNALLSEKYSSLFENTVLSNAVLAKAAAQNNVVKQTQLVSVPYAAIADAEVQVTDADIQAIYNEKKELFRLDNEMRQLQYIDVEIKASESDRAALDKQMNTALTQFQAGEDVAKVVRNANSLIPYTGMAYTREAFPADIASALDSMAVGAVKGAFYSAVDNSQNIIKLIARTQETDSIQFAQIAVPGSDVADMSKRADSIIAVLQAGASLDSLAAKMGQQATKNWVTAQQLNGVQGNPETLKFLTALQTTASGSFSKVEASQGVAVIAVYDRKGSITKYNAAVVKRTVDFSSETHKQVSNSFNSFIASNNNSFEAMQKTAVKHGYVVNNVDITTSQHGIAQIPGSQEAMRWAFTAEKGDVSEVFEVANGSRLLLVGVSEINEPGYRPFEAVKEQLRTEALNKKKAEHILSKLSGDAFAKAQSLQGATTDSLSVSFATSPFIAATGSLEPVVSGLAAATKVGATSKAAKGNTGVFVLKVNAESPSQPTDLATVKQTLRQQAYSLVGNFMVDLSAKAKIKDNRYRFFN